MSTTVYSTPLSLRDLRRIADKLRAYRTYPRVIETEYEAMVFTHFDEHGHVWSVGEEYYQCS